MKLIYLIEDFSIKGGAERIISEKVNFLEANCGHDITVVSVYHDDRPPGYRLNKGVKLVSLNVEFTDNKGNIAMRTIKRAATLMTALRRFNKIVKDTRPDIIFFTMVIGALLLPLCRTKARKVYESHSAHRFTPYSRMFGLMERKADAVVCLTADDAREYKAAKRVEVIPNFVNTPDKYVADYGVKKAIAVGRLEHVKGFDLLIDCWKDVAKTCPDWQLDIYGEGSLHDELQRQITRCGLDGRVMLRGRCEDMNEAYASHSMQIVTSRYEGLSLVLAEGQACGLPCVTVDYIYGARDIAEDGYNGIIVPQNDSEALTRAIIRMAGDEALRAKYGANARLTISKFDRDNIMNKWKELIGSICDKK